MVALSPDEKCGMYLNKEQIFFAFDKCRAGYHPGLSVDGFWSPVERNGYGTERNGSASGFGMVRNERNG